MGGLYLFIYDWRACTKEVLGMKFSTPKNNWIYYQNVIIVIPITAIVEGYLILEYSTSSKFGSTQKNF